MYKTFFPCHTTTIIGPPPLILPKIKIILNPPLIKVPGLMRVCQRAYGYRPGDFACNIFRKMI